MPTINLTLDQIEEAETIHSSIVGKRRWFVEQEVIFNHEGKIYRAVYDRPATETIESPYEDGDQITCTEVIPIEKTITVYEPVK